MIYLYNINFKKILIFIFLLFFYISMSDAADNYKKYADEIHSWRSERVASLTKPDGWLSLTGLHWLNEGDNRIGSKDTNDIVIEKLPEHLGVVILQKHKLTISLNKDVDSSATIDGKAEKFASLLPDSTGKPTVVQSGTTRFYVIERGGKFGLRVKDSEAATRKNFAGIDYFDIDPSWRVEARWEPFDSPKEIEIPSIIGTVEKYPAPGVLIFKRNEKEFRLIPYIETPGDNQLFLVFADRTSGKESYGAARFLYVNLPKENKIVVDFNKAYNPPCAFTAFATCPLAPPENRLDLRVTAGEKKYRGGAGH